MEKYKKKLEESADLRRSVKVKPPLRSPRRVANLLSGEFLYSPSKNKMQPLSILLTFPSAV